LSRVRAADPEDAAVVGRDPLRARVRYTADDETLTVTVDESLEVLDVERSRD
ncbi:ArsR family transcriptional regulator, partial [Halobacteriales archaeon SW_12_71_31]